MINPMLIPEDPIPNGDGKHSTARENTMEPIGRRDKTRKSALWAAYGDALGWISELTDEKGVLRRTGGESLSRPVQWNRRIGGRGGIVASLPRGCYSDDSQLRLATGRAIRPDGFDVEAFSKVELPVWLSYALGGGKSTTAASENLAKPKVHWFANNYNRWAESGGNGAAMRIQPHVWSAHDPGNPDAFLLDVMRNAVCTHSHPTGLMGAVFHALSLAHTFSTGHYPMPEDSLAAIEVAGTLPELIHGNVELEAYWRSIFERELDPFDKAWAKAVSEVHQAVSRVAKVDTSKSGAERYKAIADCLGIRKPSLRGSGILTAVAALGLIWCEDQPESALSIAANELDTDTDTIATMAGAILGVNADSEPVVEVLDADLFRSEADRLVAIAQGGKPPSHQYPDLLHWSAPKTRSDALVCNEIGDLYVLGMGPARAKLEPTPSSQRGFMWQWVTLETGQTLLIKRRAELEQVKELPSHSVAALPADQFVSNTDDFSKYVRGLAQPDESVQYDSPSPHNFDEKVPSLGKFQLDLQAALEHIEKHKADDKVIGASLRRVVNKGTPGQIAAFTAALIDQMREMEEHT